MSKKQIIFISKGSTNTVKKGRAFSSTGITLMRETFWMTFIMELAFFKRAKDSTTVTLEREDNTDMESLNGIMGLSTEGSIIWEFGRGRVNTLTGRVQVYLRGCGRMGN